MLLTLGLSLTVAVPLVTSLLTETVRASLLSRATPFPYLVGAPGSSADLTVNSLYFHSPSPAPLGYGITDELKRDELVDLVPLHVRFTTHDYPIVGTTLQYFQAIELEAIQGKFFQRWGDCVIGSEVARDRRIGPGDHLVSDSESFLNPAGALPLRLRVVGVLPELNSPDDRAVFVELETAWILEGIGHGHDASLHDSDDGPDESRHSNLTAGGTRFLEVTEENRASFHFHGEKGNYPVTALLAFPRSQQKGIIWEGRFQERDDLQVVRPKRVIGELVGVLLNIQKIVNGLVITLGVVVTLLLSVIVVFSLKLRHEEMETFRALGASRSIRVQLILADFLMIAFLSIPLVGLLVFGLAALAEPWLRQIVF